MIESTAENCRRALTDHAIAGQFKLAKLVLMGLRISVYTRIVRLALAEKKLEYDFTEIDIFDDNGAPDDYLECNPFGKIPCLKDGEFSLFETTAITRYLDESFAGKKLQPTKPKQRARMNQIIAVLDCYTYRPMIWDVYVQRMQLTGDGTSADEALIAAALPGLHTVLQLLEQWRAGNPFLVGNALSLADLHAYPMLCYFVDTEEGAKMLEAFPGLEQWLQQMQTRSSVAATRFHAAKHHQEVI